MLYILELVRTIQLMRPQLIHYSGNHRSFGVPCTTEDKRKVDLAFLDKYATKQWEAILHFMVGTRNDVQPGSGVIQLLLKSGLMEKYVKLFKPTMGIFAEADCVP